MSDKVDEYVKEIEDYSLFIMKYDLTENQARLSLLDVDEQTIVFYSPKHDQFFLSYREIEAEHIAKDEYMIDLGYLRDRDSTLAFYMGGSNA